MIINPFLKDSNSTRKDNKFNLEDKKEFVSNTIEYIFNEYGDFLLKSSDNKEFIEKIIEEKIKNSFFDKNEIISVKNSIINKFFGYDFLQAYIEDESITDIRAVSYNLIYIKQQGEWKVIKDKFNDKKEFVNFVRGSILKNGGRINIENPLVVVSDKKNNLRIEAGISPVNVLSPSITIRIHRESENYSLEKLLINEFNMLNVSIYLFLMQAIKNEKNIIISGKGGSGKTTLLRAILNKIENNKSIAINEETAEIMLKDRNVIQRECVKNKNNEIDLDVLSKQSMLMSNDVIVVGEIKGNEAFHFLDAISTGHVGLATVHANNSQNTIDRINLLIKRNERANTYSSEFIEKYLSSNIDYIIYIKNFKIKEILEIKYDKKPIYKMLFNL